MNRNCRNAIVLGCLLGLGQLAAAGHEAEPVRRITETVTVRVYCYARVPDGVWERAREAAAGIFAGAGVDLRWVACPTTGAERARYPDCRRPMGPRDLILYLKPTAPPEYAERKGVSGAALLAADGGPGNTALVFYDRIEQMIWARLWGATDGLFAVQLPSSMCTSITLGMVIAHELGHLFLGADSHSRKGIMRPRWNRRDLEDIYWGRLTFTLSQAEQIHADLRARDAAGLTSLASKGIEGDGIEGRQPDTVTSRKRRKHRRGQPPRPSPTVVPDGPSSFGLRRTSSSAPLGRRLSRLSLSSAHRCSIVKRGCGMTHTYIAKYVKIPSGYMGQLVDWPEVVTEGGSLEECRAMLEDAVREMVAAYQQQNKEIPQGRAIIEQIPVEV